MDDEGISLLGNDFSALWMSFLALSGYLLWYLICFIKYHKSFKKPLGLLLKMHASSWVLLAIISLILLAVTGIVLEHNKLFTKFLRNTQVSHTVLPPVYCSLKEDIRSIDLHEGVYRMGLKEDEVVSHCG
ncbi:MAG: hypothetical protein GQ531_09980 [Sulfurovum sp.]|nr:hypothetical protein [Sulfurovum sp.]